MLGKSIFQIRKEKYSFITISFDMAKTQSSKSGVQKKKIVVVKGYKKKDGTKVQDHRRSTPN
jgi:hypothetical protein